jgi:hypothetical protein
MKANKKFDLLIVLLLLGITAGISLIFNLKPAIGGVLYTLIPSLYLILRKKKNFWKIFWAVIVLGVIFGFVFDFIVTLNDGWIVPRLVFPFRLFGFYPVFDDILGFMLMTLFIVVFYEHFLDDEKNKRISRNLKWLLVASLAGLVFMFIIYFINPGLLKLPYIYLITGLAAIIFPLLFSLNRPRFLNKVLRVSAFFFAVWFIAELVALKTGGWIFPGKYIGMVEVFGLRFPFEELFFWMLWYAATVVSYYECFIDDKK